MFLLQIEFEGEEGTGLGPSLEFYSLTACEFQRKDLKMWLCDDAELLQDEEVSDWKAECKASWIVHWLSD